MKFHVITVLTSLMVSGLAAGEMVLDAIGSKAKELEEAAQLEDKRNVEEIKSVVLDADARLNQMILNRIGTGVAGDIQAKHNFRTNLSDFNSYSYGSTSSGVSVSSYKILNMLDGRQCVVGIKYIIRTNGRNGIKDLRFIGATYSSNAVPNGGYAEMGIPFICARENQVISADDINQKFADLKTDDEFVFLGQSDDD